MCLCDFGVSSFDVCGAFVGCCGFLLVCCNALRSCFVAGCLSIRCLFGVFLGFWLDYCWVIACCGCLVIVCFGFRLNLVGYVIVVGLIVL